MPLVTLLLLLPALAASTPPPSHVPPPRGPAHAPIFDCNGNGIEDSVDIAVGTSVDSNWNAIPDECEERFAPRLPFPRAWSVGTSMASGAGLEGWDRRASLPGDGR